MFSVIESRTQIKELVCKALPSVHGVLKISFSKVITLSKVTREEMIDSLYEGLAQKISYCCKESGH